MENKTEKLSRSQKITIGVTIGVVFLGCVLQLLVKIWYSPDIRYECGSYYKLKDQAVVSCKLKNYGHKTADSIWLYAKFKSNILDFQLSPFTRFTIMNGEIGKNEIVIEIGKIVPSGNVTAFFATQEIQREPFIEKIEYEDGIAKTGRPILWDILFGIVFYLITVALVLYGFHSFSEKKETQ